MIIEISDSSIETTSKALIAVQSNRDTEVAHSDADDILVGLLSEMGLDDIVHEWDRVKKWYA